MPNFSWILSLEPMTAIIIVVVMGVSFAIVVGLRLKYQYSVINELKEAINKANERISEIHTENEVNKTNIKWLKNPLNKPND
jgi:hypothetical protein